MRILTRLLAVLVLLGVVAGGIWYVLIRETPTKQVKRLTTKIDVLLDDQKSAGWEAVLDEGDRQWLAEKKKKLEDSETRFDLARKAADRVLEIAGPTSVPHVQQRAFIEDRAGKPAEALRIYDATLGVSRLPANVHYHKAQLFRKLGRLDKAKGSFQACADQFPYQANLFLGRIELSFNNPRGARDCFERALEFTPKEGDGAMMRIDPLEGKAEASSLSLSLDPQSKASTTWIRERADALDEALLILEKKRPDPGAAHVAHFKRVAGLYTAYDDDEHLRNGIASLEKAVTDGAGREHAAIHEKLGQLRLTLADRGKDRAPLVEAAEKDFDRALQLAPSLTFDGVKDADSRNIMILRIAEHLLNHGEGWRLVEAEREGKKDPLGIKEGLDKIASAAGTVPSEQVRILQGLTLIRQGKDADGEKMLLDLVAEIEKKTIEEAVPEETKEDRQKAARAARAVKARELALTCRRAVPDSMVFLKLLAPADEGAAWQDTASRSLPLIESAIEHWKKKGDDAKVAILTAERDTRLRAAEEAAGKSPEDLDGFSIIAARYKGLPAAVEASRKALRMAESAPSPAGVIDTIRYRLANFLNAQARQVEAQSAQAPSTPPLDRPWMATYREALGQYLFLYKEYPFAREIQEPVVGIVRKFQSLNEDPKLEDLLVPVFPGAKMETLGAFADVIGSLLRNDVKGLSEKARALQGNPELGAYGSLIIAAILSTESAALAREQVPEKERAARDARAKELLVNARTTLKTEVDRASGNQSIDEIPIDKSSATLLLAYHQVRLALLETAKGQEDPELDAILKGLQRLAAESAKLPPSLSYNIFALQAGGNLLRFTSLFLQLDGKRDRPEGFDAGKATKTALGAFEARRAALRRQIELNPDITGPYLDLAGTYVGVRSPASQPNSKFLVEPQYGNAISLAKGAPESGFLEAIAKNDFISQVYEEGLRTPKEALEFRQRSVSLALAIAKVQPPLVTGAFQGLISCYLKIVPGKEKDLPDPFSAAEEAINKFGNALEDYRKKVAQANVFPDYPIFAEKFRALLAVQRKDLAPPGDQASLRDDAIGHYRNLMKMGEEMNSPPTVVEAANNLAWFLADAKIGFDEALGAIGKARETVENMPESVKKQFAPAIEDTAGYVYFQKGEYQKAEETYRKFLNDSSAPEYMIRFARVLEKISKDADALEWVQKAIDTGLRPESKLLKEAVELRDRLQLGKARREQK